MQRTTNYNLNQWEDGDVVRREDFNADNAAIDAALKSVSDAAANAPEIVIGYYVGNGNASQNINLGRKPKAVLVEAENGLRGANVSSGPYGGLATTITGVFNNTQVVKITDTGFTAYTRAASSNTNAHANDNGMGYSYIAFF